MDRVKNTLIVSLTITIIFCIGLAFAALGLLVLGKYSPRCIKQEVDCKMWIEAECSITNYQNNGFNSAIGRYNISFEYTSSIDNYQSTIEADAFPSADNFPIEGNGLYDCWSKTRNVENVQFDCPYCELEKERETHRQNLAYASFALLGMFIINMCLFIIYKLYTGK